MRIQSTQTNRTSTLGQKVDNLSATVTSQFAQALTPAPNSDVDVAKEPPAIDVKGIHNSMSTASYQQWKSMQGEQITLPEGIPRAILTADEIAHVRELLRSTDQQGAPKEYLVAYYLCEKGVLLSQDLPSVLEPMGVVESEFPKFE